MHNYFKRLQTEGYISVLGFFLGHPILVHYIDDCEGRDNSNVQFLKTVMVYDLHAVWT